jgi:hypothetical protein
MAGERYSKITIRAAWSWVQFVRANQTVQIRFKLSGQWRTFRRGPNPNNNEYAVPAPNDVNPSRDFVKAGVGNMLALLRLLIAQQGLPYTISALRDVGDDSSHVGQGSGFSQELVPWPIIEFDITATTYDPAFDLDFIDDSPHAQGYDGWTTMYKVGGIKPVYVTPQVTDAVIYNSATGAITLVASNGNYGLYSYAWADPGAPTTATRTNLVGPASYTCVVSDYSGASTSITVPVGSDPRLDVAVQKIANDVTLVTTGGVGPYTYQWSDGNTSDVRPGMAAGTYSCLVTDSHGAQVTVTVTIDGYNKFYFSRNPVVLELAASNLATKPNLRFLCEVWVETTYLSGVFVNIAGELVQPADVTGRTTFDVSTLLDAYVQPDWPDHGQAGVQQAPQCFKRFYLQHSEQWDGSPARTYTVRETHYLVYGGLDFDEYATQSYFTYLRPTVRPFLTWEPVQKEVYADQPEFLYYHHDSLTDKTFSVVVTFTDSAGASTSAVLYAAAGVQCFEVWRAGVGLRQLRAALGPAVPADVVAWSVTVTSSATGSAFSETRYYQLSEELPAERRYFLYANSIAGINTLACVGKAKREVTFSNTVVQRSLQPKYDPAQGDAFATNVAGVPVLTANTGYLNREQLAALQDFLLSEEIRYSDTDRYRAGTLVPADTLLLEDDDNPLLSVDIAFTLATMRRYTPTLPR